MCGIAAIFCSEKTLQTKLNGLANDLLLLLQVRGTDAAGIAQVTKKFGIAYFKRPFPASDVIAMPKAKLLLNDADSAYATILHCRKTTSGSDNVHAAHPFVIANDKGVDEFAMVHNGTLTNWNTATQKESVSDSDWLSGLLYKNEQSTLENLKGAAAMIWTNTEEGSHSFFTNGERPLYYANIKDMQAVIIGSEPLLLHAALVRNGLTVEDDDYIECTTNVLYKSDYLNVKDISQTDIIPVVTNYSKGKRNSFKNRGNYSEEDYYNNYYNNNKANDYSLRTEETVLEKLKALKKNKVIELLPSPKNNVTSIENKPANVEILESEASLLLRLTSVQRPEVLAKISWRDSNTGEVYLEITDIISEKARGIQKNQVVVIRNITEKHYDYLEKTYKELYLSLGGVEEVNKEFSQLASYKNPTYIARNIIYPKSIDNHAAMQSKLPLRH